MAANNLKVDNNIFLGNKVMASNHNLIKNMNIQRILSIGYKRIAENSERLPNVYYKDIPLKDYSEELIGIFYECFNYISETQKYG